MVIDALFQIDRKSKYPGCLPTDEWIKMWDIYPFQHYSDIKLNKTMKFLGKRMRPNTILTRPRMGLARYAHWCGSGTELWQ